MSKNIALVSIVVVGMQFSLPAIAAGGDEHKVSPIELENISGTKYKQLKLTEKAIRRLDIKTSSIRASKSGTTIAPYAAITYGLDGTTWVHVNSGHNTYVRKKVVIDHISGSDAVLKEGPPIGTVIVTRGVSELYGAEKGVGH